MTPKPTPADVVKWSVAALEILDKAATLIAKKYARKDAFTSPDVTKEYLKYRMVHQEQVMQLSSDLIKSRDFGRIIFDMLIKLRN